MAETTDERLPPALGVKVRSWPAAIFATRPQSGHYGVAPGLRVGRLKLKARYVVKRREAHADATRANLVIKYKQRRPRIAPSEADSCGAALIEFLAPPSRAEPRGRREPASALRCSEVRLPCGAGSKPRSLDGLRHARSASPTAAPRGPRGLWECGPAHRIAASESA